MPRLGVVLLLACVLLLIGLLSLTGAEETEGDSRDSRVQRSVPNWALTSSDFFAWVEELRSHAGYEQIEELARTFWAHFPSASRLGYDADEPEE